MNSEQSNAGKDVAQEHLRDIYNRPGFLLRRAHQIASAIFANVTADLNVTTTQFGVLTVLAAREPVDQIGIARDLRLDRSTTGLVIKNLEERGLIERLIDPDDKRRRVLRLTAAGAEMLEKLRMRGKDSHEQLLTVFTPVEARAFSDLLAKFIGGHDIRP